MSRVVMAREFGGPDVLKIEERTLAAPGAGEVKVRHTAIGVNFADISMLQGR